MDGILMGATLLICVVVLVRKLTKGKVSMRFRYALWIVVALRLVVPVSFGSSPLSIQNLSVGLSAYAPHAAEGLRGYLPENGEEDRRGTDAGEPAGIQNGTRLTSMDSTGPGEGAERPDPKQTGPTAAGTERMAGEAAGQQGITGTDLIRYMRVRLLLLGIWAAGSMAVGGYMLISQIRFSRNLRHARKKAAEDTLPEVWNRRLQARGMHVYTVAGLPSPCLVGRNIYIGTQLMADQDRLRHVLAHEYAHAVQRDTLWAILRSALCAVYWFYPLVWIAAYEAKKDSELACDERALLFLGETERFAYGRTLLDLLSGRSGKNGYAGAILIMGGSRQNMKERVCMIAGKRKNRKGAAVLAAFSIVLMCGCAFTGAEESQRGQKIQLTNQGSLHVGASEVTEDREEEENGRQETEFGQEQGKKEAELQAQMRRIEETMRDVKDVEVFGIKQMAFQELLDSADDSGLAEAAPVDIAAYYDYLYEGEACPLEDGKWYRLMQEKEPRIAFYGLYTQEYGCRGMKIEIDGDVTTFDQSWIPSFFDIDVLVLEEAETDGMPRSFAFTVCVANDGESEMWDLYVADRYDTGTITLSYFGVEACLRQIEEQKITFRVDSQEKEVAMFQKDEVLGRVDCSHYAENRIKEALWDQGIIGYQLEAGAQDQIILKTGIGLQASEGGKMFYHGLSLIAFPVEIGTFGDRSFALGSPRVDEKFVSGKRNS